MSRSTPSIVGVSLVVKHQSELKENQPCEYDFCLNVSRDGRLDGGGYIFANADIFIQLFVLIQFNTSINQEIYFRLNHQLDLMTQDARNNNNSHSSIRTYRAHRRNYIEFFFYVEILHTFNLRSECRNLMLLFSFKYALFQFS